jgi:hypothetical protein
VAPECWTRCRCRCSDRVGVLQVGVDRGDDDADFDGDEVDPDKRHTHPCVDDNPLVEDAIKHVDKAGSAGRTLNGHGAILPVPPEKDALVPSIRYERLGPQSVLRPVSAYPSQLSSPAYVAATGCPFGRCASVSQHVSAQVSAYFGACLSICSGTLQESHVESCEDEDDSDVHCQPFPEPVSEEQEIYGDYDGCHERHVKCDSCPCSHVIAPMIYRRISIACRSSVFNAEPRTYAGTGGWWLGAGHTVAAEDDQPSEVRFAS